MNWETLKNNANSSLSRILSQKGLTIHFVYKNETFEGVKTTLKRSDRNSDLGLIEGDYTFSIIAKSKQFDAMPQPRKDKIQIDGITYRVLSVDVDGLSATYKLNLGTIQQ